MEKYNDLIKHEATKLRIKHRMNELTEMECEDFVRGILRQALIIDSVSQQRELLKAFQEYYQTGDYNDEYPFDENINRFLKAFNCG